MKLVTSFGYASPFIRSMSAPLTNPQLREAVPSIFAESKHDSRSDRFGFVPTIEIIDSLRKEGFEPFYACQGRTRVEDRRAFTKHMVRMRHPSSVSSKEANEVILVNGHDGTCSLQLMAGMFRAVCKNGIFVGDVVEDVRIPHRGSIIDDAIEGSYRILKEFELVDAHKEEMKATILTHQEQERFAKVALKYKYGDMSKCPVTPANVLAPTRYEDVSSDLWTIFNRVQESLIRGGIRGITREGRRTKTRPVNSIDQNVKLNKELWNMAEAIVKDKSLSV